MLKVQFPDSNEAITIDKPDILHIERNIYDITITLDHSISTKNPPEPKFWIDGVASIDAKLKNISQSKGKYYVTFHVLLEK